MRNPAYSYVITVRIDSKNFPKGQFFPTERDFANAIQFHLENMKQIKAAYVITLSQHKLDKKK